MDERKKSRKSLEFQTLRKKDPQARRKPLPGDCTIPGRPPAATTKEKLCITSANGFAGGEAFLQRFRSMPRV
jgi:hypothetical protein